MNRDIIIIICLLVLGIIACNNHKDKATTLTPKFDCNILTDKKIIYEIAQSIIENHDNEQIWNLSEIDTSEFFTTEDYFTNAKTKNRLVHLGGFAGGSSGSASNLLILFSCSDTFKVLWAGQVGDLSENEIADLNGDGIKEIIINSGATFMGECNDMYEIFNFKNNKQNFLYTAHSRSIIECGLENLYETHFKGDTLENHFDVSLQKNKDNKFNIKQIHTVKIHNGGETDEEILNNLVISIDTAYINLK